MSTELHEVDTTSVKQKHLLVIEKTLSVRIETLLLPVHILGSRFKFQMFAIFCTLLEIDPTCVRINQKFCFKSHSLHPLENSQGDQNVVISNVSLSQG